jgi:transcriptional regulator with XRE-family HTH domain
MASDAATTGARIRRRRQELDMTQKELAERVNVDESSVINWETGKHYPKRKLGALELVLGIRLDGEDEKPLRPISAHTRREIEGRLSPEDAARVIGLLEGTIEVIAPGEEPGEGAVHPRAAG